jgi:cytidylate kinase
VPEKETGGVCQGMIVTVGGYPGSGTTTLSKKIAGNYELNHVYAGQIFRDMAALMGISLKELSKKAEADDSIDLAVDQKQKELGVENTVVEGRMAAHIIDADLKIWLSAPLEERAKRIASRENISYDESVEKIRGREASERKRYKKFYRVDMDNLSLYDLVINTGLWDAEGVFQIVKAAIEVRKW